MQFTMKACFFLLACLFTLVSSRPLAHHHRRCVHRTPPTPSASAGSLNASGSASSVHVSATHSAKPSSTKTSSASESTSTGKSSHDNNDGKDDGKDNGSDSGKDNDSNDDDSSSSSGSSSQFGKGLLKALFPANDGSSSWSTNTLFGDVSPLSDDTFRPTKKISALDPDYVSAPDGKKAMRAHFPKGSYTFTHSPLGGLSFYAPGPKNVDLTEAKEATFGYSVYFPKGFQFNKGGKLPGLYGGNSDEEAVSCSGGRRSTKCFSARLMWRTEGAGEFYTYLPPYTIPEFSANKKQCNVAPESDCNDTYGASVGRGAFKFATGAWTTVSERVKLNDAGKANGEIELFVNGKSEISVKGLMLRDGEEGKLRGIQMQTFFGGSGSEWASPKDQDIYFSDFSVAITQKF
jgi:hypothetical protein